MELFDDLSEETQKWSIFWWTKQSVIYICYLHCRWHSWIPISNEKPLERCMFVSYKHTYFLDWSQIPLWFLGCTESHVLHWHLYSYRVLESCIFFYWNLRLQEWWFLSILLVCQVFLPAICGLCGDTFPPSIIPFRVKGMTGEGYDTRRNNIFSRPRGAWRPT